MQEKMNHKEGNKKTVSLETPLSQRHSRRRTEKWSARLINNSPNA